jgi:hypothetical protein
VSYQPPSPEELHQWGWEAGLIAGRQIAEEADAFIGIATCGEDAPAALPIYGRAVLRALIQSYRSALAAHHTTREDIAAELWRRTALTQRSKERS